MKSNPTRAGRSLYGNFHSNFSSPMKQCGPYYRPHCGRGEEVRSQRGSVMRRDASSLCVGRMTTPQAGSLCHGTGGINSDRADQQNDSQLTIGIVEQLLQALVERWGQSRRPGGIQQANA